MHLLGQLIGLDFTASPHVAELLGDEPKFRAQAFEAGALYLRRLGDTRPVVVVVLDDLHWADAGSMDFMRFVLQRDGDVPLLSLTLTRQTMYEEHADWMRGEPRHTRLDLKPLDHACSRELAEALLQRIRGVPRSAARPGHRRRRGQPVLHGRAGEDAHRRRRHRGRARRLARGATTSCCTCTCPPTLTGVLQARLDALGADEHRAMQQAAVVGHVFWDQALAAIDPAALDCLPLLLAEAAGGPARCRVLRRHPRVRLQAPPAAPGDLRQRAQGAQAQRPCARGRLLERTRRGGGPQQVDPSHAARWPRRSTTAARPMRRTMSGGSKRSSRTTSRPMQRRRCRPLVEQLVRGLRAGLRPRASRDGPGADQRWRAWR